MKRMISILLSLIILNCNCFTQSTFSINLTDKGKTELVGELTIDEWNQYSKQDTTSPNDDLLHMPNISELKLVFKQNKNLKIIIVGASWCGDTEVSFPIFFKIIKMLDLEPNRYTIYGINRAKTEPKEVCHDYHIEKVPTLIVFDGKAEINRIIETPNVSWDEDLLNIIKD